MHVGWFHLGEKLASGPWAPWGLPSAPYLPLGLAGPGTTLTLTPSCPNGCHPSRAEGCSGAWGWPGCGWPQSPSLAWLALLEAEEGDGLGSEGTRTSPNVAWHSLIHHFLCTVPMDCNIVDFLANNVPKCLIVSEGCIQPASSSYVAVGLFIYLFLMYFQAGGRWQQAGDGRTAPSAPRAHHR